MLHKDFSPGLSAGKENPFNFSSDKHLLAARDELRKHILSLLESIKANSLEIRWAGAYALSVKAGARMTGHND